MTLVLLTAAILAETIATLSLKASDGFSRLWPSLLSVFGYAVAFFSLSLALRTIPVGVAYAIWSGVGIVLVGVLGRVLFNQVLDGPALAGIGLILSGVLVLQLFSRAGSGSP